MTTHTERGVAFILALRHDRLANKYVYRMDDKGTFLFYLHHRASVRFKRIAEGKPPFKKDY